MLNKPRGDVQVNKYSHSGELTYSILTVYAFGTKDEMDLKLTVAQKAGTENQTGWDCNFLCEISAKNIAKDQGA